MYYIIISRERTDRDTFYVALFITIHVCSHFNVLSHRNMYTPRIKTSTISISTTISHIVQSYLTEHPSWIAVIAPTDRPKSFRNRCVIEVFGGVFVLSIGL